MKKTAAIIIVLCNLLAQSALAQDTPEYRMEIGAGGGLMGYLGDFNNSITKDLQPMGGVFARYNFNSYTAMRLDLNYGKMKGSSKDVKTYYPPYSETPYEFNNTLVDLSLTYEYNLWPYGTGKEYRGAKPLTPFIFGGLGASYVNTKSNYAEKKKNIIAPGALIGIGLKYKANERLNIGLDFAMHFSMSDELDGAKDPYGITSSGPFKNTDCFSTLQLTVSYSFWARCRTCHNEDE
ncbi:MAG: outer membrane beta-barrel protein [Prevotella sp.]|nr:outer membrane beta-barrel protein [Prevotella sp.]